MIEHPKVSFLEDTDKYTFVSTAINEKVEPNAVYNTVPFYAKKSAKSYLSFSAFSYDGLKKQLEFEKYTSSEAKYGVDNCGANWNEQAAKSAKNYLSMMAFSRDQLIKQLEFEGFTHDQSVYGVSQNGY